MISQIKSVYVTDTTPNPPPVKKYIGWKCRHEIEGGRVIPTEKMPAVVPSLDSFTVEMTRAIQEMSYALMLAFCPTVTRKQWRKLHDCDNAMNNGDSGYYSQNPNGSECGGYWADWINNLNTSAQNPRYDKMRTFQGTFIRGDEQGDIIVVRAGVHCIDTRKPLPSVQTIIDNNWFSYAVNSAPDSNMSNISYFAQGGGLPIVYPFISNRDTTTFNKDFFMRWEADTLPDPLKVYV